MAVKDCIAVAGLPTGSGSAAVADTAAPATDDAACLRPLRALVDEGRATIVGTTTLHELCFGVTGINRRFGTPINPVGADLAPGGSSSGSAAAVGRGTVDVALGTDTGGSIRIPAACCGVVGLKPSHGRLPLRGVQPLAPSLDVVGPLAPHLAGVAAAMAVLDPAFAGALDRARRRLRDDPLVLGRFDAGATDDVDRAVDRLLRRSGLCVRPVALPGWEAADRAARTVLAAEAHRTIGHLLTADAAGAGDGTRAARRSRLGADVAERLRRARTVTDADEATARAVAARWRAELAAVLATVDVVVLPTLAAPPPRLEDAHRLDRLRHTLPINLAGLPALALPAPARHGPPASVQLVGPVGADALVVAVGELLMG